MILLKYSLQYKQFHRSTTNDLKDRTNFLGKGTWPKLGQGELSKQ